jgi:hypothetical protein
VRMRLHSEEGVSIPAKVRTFSGGVWTGKWMPYQRDPNGIARITAGGSGNSTAANGERIQLDSNSEVAKTQLLEIQDQRQSWIKSLGLATEFRKRMTSREVRCIPSAIGTSRFGDTLIATSDSGKAAGLLEAVGRLVVAAPLESGVNRKVVIGYFRGNTHTGALVNQVIAAGFNVMTPEEFVEEFRPKDGEQIEPTEEPTPTEGE